MRPPSVVGAFFLRTLAWLAVTLTLWYAAREWMVVPSAWLAEQVMRGFFHYWVTGSELDGTTHTLLTALTVRSPDGRLGELLPSANLMSTAYGTPLAAALLLASQRRGWWWKLPLAALALVPFQSASVCLTWLMQVAALSGKEIAAQAGFGSWHANLYGAGYQLGFLLLPTLMPVLVWLSLDRSLIARVMLEGALASAGINGADRGTVKSRERSY